MTTICPKCHHVRPAHADNPAWQCPACGVCYAKVGGEAPLRRAAPPAAVAQPWDIPWGKLILLAVLAALAWGGRSGLQAWRAASPVITAQPTVDELHALAATVRPGEVVMYTTTECVYCAQAKSWLSGYGFPFTECNMTLSASCEREFLSYGAKGTPFLLVRGQQMHNGFDSDEFLQLLREHG